MADIYDSTWSQTDSSNTTLFAEGQAPSTVNNGMRAVQGALKRAWIWDHPTATSTGSANVQVLTYSVAPASLATGIQFAFIPGFTNTASCTVNVNSLGAITVYYNGLPLTGGEIKATVIAVIMYDGTHFQLLNPVPVMRVKLTADKIVYVDGTSGNDSTGDGTSGTPWATLQHAYSYLINNIDAGGHAVTINQQGTDTAGLLVDFPMTGAPYVNLVLNGTINTGSSAGITVFREGGLNITGNGSITAASFGVVCKNAGYLQVSGITFDAVAATHIYAQIGGVIVITGSYSIGGNAANHFAADTNGSITVFPSATITLNGTRVFSGSFALASTDGDINADHTLTTFSGSATGVRYFASTGGGIYTNGGGATFFPGSTSGSLDASTYGWYA